MGFDRIGFLAVVMAAGPGCTDEGGRGTAGLTGVGSAGLSDGGDDVGDVPGDDGEDDGDGDGDGDSDSDGGDDVSFDLGQMPDVDLEVERGCHKVDFLFVIDNSGSMVDDQDNLAANFPGFIDGIQATLDEVDAYHVGVVTTDAYGHNAAGCKVLGGLVSQTGGPDSSASACGPWSDGHYMTEADDLASGFACAAKVGSGGFPIEKPMNAMEAAVRGDHGAPGACNEGFIRDDALLVVTVITDEWDGPGDPELLGSMGNAGTWYQTVVDAKGGFPENVVVISIVHSGACPPPEMAFMSGDIEPFTNMFGDNGYLGCIDDDHAALFAEATSVIEGALRKLRPARVTSHRVKVYSRGSINRGRTRNLNPTALPPCRLSSNVTSDVPKIGFDHSQRNVSPLLAVSGQSQTAVIGQPQLEPPLRLADDGAAQQRVLERALDRLGRDHLAHRGLVFGLVRLGALHRGTEVVDRVPSEVRVGDHQRDDGRRRALRVGEHHDAQLLLGHHQHARRHARQTAAVRDHRSALVVVHEPAEAVGLEVTPQRVVGAYRDQRVRDPGGCDRLGGNDLLAVDLAVLQVHEQPARHVGRRRVDRPRRPRVVDGQVDVDDVGIALLGVGRGHVLVLGEGGDARRRPRHPIGSKKRLASSASQVMPVTAWTASPATANMMLQ